MFGLFNLMGYRERGTSTSKIMAETTALVRLADQGGFEMAWFAEHHFSNYCVCPSPLMMVAHCAATVAHCAAMVAHRAAMVAHCAANGRP